MRDRSKQGYGLTLGSTPASTTTIEAVNDRLSVGNVYVNRNMIGAVVGVQPFGGQGLSGTGPKAGGPHYLPRFAAEQTVTINTAAAGGNAALLLGFGLRGRCQDDGLACSVQRLSRLHDPGNIGSIH